jgi:hypothetical protein
MARKTKNPVDMSTLFQSSKGTLAHITSKTNSLTMLDDIVRQICPDLPADVWHIGNLSSGSLRIEVKSSTWGQRLQFERSNICQQLSEKTEGMINKIEIKVNPFLHKMVIKEKVVEKTQFISLNTAKQLNDVAKTAPKGLKEKLEKLANLAKKNNNE